VEAFGTLVAVLFVLVFVLGVGVGAGGVALIYFLMRRRKKPPRGFDVVPNLEGPE
jgi:hypothetical protein